MTPARQLGVIDILIPVVVTWVLIKLARGLVNRKARGTKLNGPPSDSFIFGISRRIAQSTDRSLLFQEWAAEYGPVFRLPAAFGGHKTILCDSKAVNHFYSMERSVYVKSKLGRAVIENSVCIESVLASFPIHCYCIQFGRGLLWAEGESHKRQVVITLRDRRPERHLYLTGSAKH
jgi:hypothetical protein